MNEVERSDDLPKDELLDKQEAMIEQSRDILHKRPDATSAAFDEELLQIMKSFKTGYPPCPVRQ
ncbi:hypothetical protein D0C36_16045 [Mucilaginibacter conchicola]|uniref:Uncharacterized protein n=1 Tax=Mucilaginibacter conchicola TaxID=2303333 RepID=A0A372NUX6_9SPHI|nr:hypothetical protein [Mucilaginibacter conchicola]RFZ92902.1 hypothetical protein D0C36_16045 [Mucilaginibacter conchicola]